MAPEIESGRYDRKCDIWSTGCVLFELCTLNYAFEGNKKDELSKNIKNHNVSNKLAKEHILYDLIMNK